MTSLRTAIALASCSLLLLSSCGGTPEAPSTPTTTVVVAPPAAEASSTPAPVTSPTPTASPTPVATKHNINSGQVGGKCGTTAEGLEIRAGSKTSCDFAAVLYDHALEQTFTLRMGASGNAVYRTESFSAHSPATGQSYQISCRIGSDGSGLTCDDPNSGNALSATVYLPRPAHWKDRLKIG